MKLSFVIPTYNEAGNIKELISEIRSVCKENKYSQEIIIVDDNSPDSTGLIAKKLGVRVLIRKDKRGLGSAYKDGFKLVSKNADAVIMMDADLSHDPQEIPRFVNAINKGAEIAQGSRKIKGGKIEANWSPMRYLISYISSVITLPLTGIKDPNGSYKCIKTSALKKLKLEKTTDGFGFLIELLYLANKQGIKITEVPITFKKRLAGESKLRFKEIKKNFKIYLNLYLDSLKK
ncbi:MAG TPA: polyprenol monophosphomannose synthase [Candidatus Nanoarchaeia archaeon]|nr:polyprenol monophosphomannose synthase [Candidatus Nanoarchaeia archaeon]